MSYPGASSGRSKVRNLSERSPGGVPAESSGNGLRDGMGGDRRGGFKSFKSEAERRSAEAFARAGEFARTKLPNESRTWAAGAFLSERYRLGRDPSVDEVRARLVATGRDAGSIDPKVLAAERSWCEARGI